MDAMRSVRWPSAVTALLVLAAAFASLAALAPRAAATTYVSGPITTNTTWGLSDPTVVLTGDVVVRPGGILNITPGTTVLADPGLHLYVEGQLLANGTSTSRILFQENQSGVPWGGIQFNATSKASYLQYASLRAADVGVRVLGAATPRLMFDAVDRSRAGFLLEGTSAWVGWSTITDTDEPIRANGTGSPVIVANTITGVRGALAIAIMATNVDMVTITSNTIRWVNGTDGAAGFPGTGGGSAIGILVTNSNWANLAGNTVDQLRGGRGGDGQGSAIGNGGNGGAGGGAAALAIAFTPYARMQNNRVTNLRGGHGGNGGLASGAVGGGGDGGDGGGAFAIETSDATDTGWWFYNTIDSVVAGSAGNGGPSVSGTVGRGGAGGAAFGLFAMRARNGNASHIDVRGLKGGFGGNSSNLLNGRAGGAGGDASGILFAGPGGDSIVELSTVSAFTGGPGGAGTTAGSGGNATAIGLLGDTASMNLTTVHGNQVSSLTGGVGGLGTLAGGAGGSAAGIAAYHVDLSTSSNLLQTLTGGTGGSPSLNTQPVGRGGDAAGMIAALVKRGSLEGDRLLSATGGAPGSGGTSPVPGRGIGFYGIGSGAVLVRATLWNATFASNGNYDLDLDDWTDVTAVNASFSDAKLAVSTAATLTVANFLRVDVHWPDNVTLVAGASILVQDGGTPVYNRTSPTGSARWLVVTDRVFVHSTTASYNATDVTVSSSGRTFASNPRTVEMNVSRTEDFWMFDTDPPTSAARPLPAYENRWTFNVLYTASDGSGRGLLNVTLHYRVDGGAWLVFASQAGAASGTFAFVATSDGVYEFATVAVDRAGNREPGPLANDTWTIIDTSVPGSYVAALPAYETSRSFDVSWAPEAGVTDISQYTIAVNSGAGWSTWRVDTGPGTATYTAAADGAYQFRSIARDRAGNTETAPATNDTWTIVDTAPPSSHTLALPVYETSTSFLVEWAPESGDIANYTIQFRDSGGPWTGWVTATNLSWTFPGALDGHTYEFRSIATDWAGNVQPTPAGNQSWTLVDLSAPSSAVAALPRYETSLSFGLTWGPIIGVTDIATYTVESSDDDGPWTPVPGAIGTTSTSATFPGADGHRYAFRSIATDRAGNVETAPLGNDTWTLVDVTRPSVTTAAPRGTGTNLTPSVTITFSEAMDRASAEAAFSIVPDMNGAFSWSADDRVMTFVPDRELQAGTSYVVAIDSSVRDLAGNTAASPYTFQFTTSSTTPNPPQPGSVLDYLWIIAIAVVAAVAGLLAFVLLRRRSSAQAAAARPAAAPAAKPVAGESVIDDVFLLYNDGILIKHETRRLKPDVDTDILSGMLTAVQQFVKDSFRSEEGELDEMTFGQMHILIGRGKWTILAAMVSGGGTDTFTDQIKRCIEDMETHEWDELESWKGDMVIAKKLTPYVKKLIQGDYGA